MQTLEGLLNDRIGRYLCIVLCLTNVVLYYAQSRWAWLPWAFAALFVTHKLFRRDY